MRKWLVALGVVFALGCSGMGEKLLELSGTEIKMGEDAEHPADFPLPPPEQGELMTSMSMGLAGMQTATVQYELPAGTDVEAVLKKYEEHLTAAGHEVQRTDQDGAKTVSAQVGDGEVITAAISKAGDKSVLSLVAVTKEP